MNRSFVPDLEELQSAVHGALASWGELGSTEDQLLGFLLLVRQQRSRYGDGRSPLRLRQATNDVLEKAIDELEEQEETEAAVLRARFIEGEITRSVANQMYASPDQVNRWQRSAIENLTRIILSQEMFLREKRKQELEAMLPAAPYGHLFGFDSLREEASDQLLLPGDPRTVLITGIGGIGKTSLADAVTREVLQQLTFEGAIWLRSGARGLDGSKLPPEQSYEQLLNEMAQTLWPDAPGAAASEQRDRVRRKLKSQPYLVVVDNLESDEETTYVLDQVRDLTEPSKFIVTSRARPAVSISAYFLTVEELPLSDATELLQHHAETIGLEELTKATESDVQAIYDSAGGNPLALKLIVSLAAVLPLEQILADLAESHPGPIEDLYRFIYLESWRSLSEDAQVLLQAMPLVAETGALPEQMRAISALDQEHFWPAVTELVSRSLLEVRGSIHERRYGIHRLTESFLRTEIIHWPEE